MTVAELVEKLRKMPQDARVLVSGYESGLNDPCEKSPRATQVHIGSDAGTSYSGDHEECEKMERPGLWKNEDCWNCTERHLPTDLVVVIER